MKAPQYYRKFNYDKRLIPNPHVAFLEQGVQNIDEATSRTGYSIGYPGWGLVYHILLSHLDAKQENIIVETGTNQGATTIILAQALKDSGARGKVYTVELEEDNYKKAVANFGYAGVKDYVDATCGDSHEFLRDFVKQHDKVRIAFLDASHLYDAVMVEFETVLPLLEPNSVVIFDNTYQIAEPHEDQRVNGALKDILKKHGGNLVNLEFVSWYTPGMAIWQRTPFVEENNG